MENISGAQVGIPRNVLAYSKRKRSIEHPKKGVSRPFGVLKIV